MNTLLLTAAGLAFLVGLVHSVLGEVLIFRRMRQGGLIPTKGGRVIEERHVRIVWASWHVLTVFGWCLAAVLLRLAGTQSARNAGLANTVAAAMLAGSALVLVATKGKHPGWIGLLAVATLARLSNY